jgi:uncharacterized protein YjiS (DUF1127 family)
MRLPTDLYISVTADDVVPHAAKTCTDTPPRALLAHTSPGNDATCDDAPISDDDTDAWVRHAYAANGFGDDSPIPTDDTHPWMRYTYAELGFGDDAPIPANETDEWMRHAHAANGFGDGAPMPANDSDPWARHAYAANGFGDGAIEARLSSYEIQRAAREHRGPLLGETISEAFRAAVATARRLYAHHRQRRSASAARKALHELNDHVLRDLGFDRGEIESIAGEVTGKAECTRIRSIWSRTMDH